MIARDCLEAGNPLAASAPIDLVTAGRIVAVYGVKGWVKIRSFTELPENLFSYRPWWISDQQGWRKIDVDDYRQPKGGMLIAHIVDINDRDAAQVVCQRDVMVERSQFPSLGGDEYYWHELVGLAVYSLVGSERVLLGQVTSLLETGANDVLVVAESSEAGARERLIPYVNSVLRRIDRVKAEIEVDWDPEF